MNESRSSANRFRIFFLAGLACIVLMGLVWSLDSFFIYLMLGAACYCFFLAYWYKPAPAIEPKIHYRGDRQRSAEKKMKIQPAAFMVLAFIGLGIFLVMAVIFFFNSTATVQYDAAIAYDQAYNFQLNEQYDSAKRWYRKVLETDPSHENAMIGMGNVFLTNQEYDSAWFYYNEAIMANPANDDAQYNKAIVRYYQQRYAESSDEAKIILERNPDYHDAEILIGDNYNALNRLDSALHWYQRAYDAGYKNPMLLHVMAYTYDQTGQSQKAIEFYKQTLELDSSQTEIYLRLSEMLSGPESERFRQLGKKYELD